MKPHPLDAFYLSKIRAGKALNGEADKVSELHRFFARRLAKAEPEERKAIWSDYLGALDPDDAEDFIEAVAGMDPEAEEPGAARFPEAPRPIRVSLRPVPPMVPELIPDSFRQWLVDIAERACCPLDLPVISAIVSIASLVSRQLGIRPRRQDNWTVVPNLWGMGVLPPGWLKTHSLEEPKKPLVRLEKESRELHDKALADFSIEKLVAETKAAAAAKALKTAAANKELSDEELRRLAAEASKQPAIEPPRLRRYIVNDTTVEKLGMLLVENPWGLLVFRDELMGWLKTLEKQGHESDRAFYLESWTGTGSFTYDRVGRGTTFIPSAVVSILGGIQPGKLASYIRSTASGENDDGLISRFQLAVYPDIDLPFRNVDRWPDTEAKNRAYDVFKALNTLDLAALGATVDPDDPGGIPYLRFAPDAQDLFDVWRTELENKVRSSQESACLTSHLSKYRSLMPSLALLFHLIEVVDSDFSEKDKVSLEAAKLAIAWCSYLEQHARRIYQSAFDGDPEPAQRLADRIRESLPDPFTIREVVRKGWSTLKSEDVVERAVALLEEHGWVHREDVPAGLTGGRPTVHFHINPLARKGGAA